MNKNQPKSRILVITSTYPRHETDYAVPWMRESHRQLKNEGNEITVMAPSYRGLKSHILDGIKVKRFRYAPAAIESLTHEEGETCKAYAQLLAIPYVLIGCIYAGWLALRGTYDVIHVHWPYPHGLMGQVARLVSGKPLVMMSHGAEFSLARRRIWVMPLLRQSLQAADLCIANSPVTASKVTLLSGRSCKVLAYGTTVNSADAQAEPAEKPRVLFTGRLIERKGLEYLLQAVPMILSRVPNAEFIITGDGDQRTRLEDLSNQLGLTQFVSFKGCVSTEELAQEYAKCNVWVNPGIIDSQGDAEGLGIGSIEAYSYFKPVVASRVGGMPDRIRDGETGYLVPQKDPKALAAAICDLLVHPEKSLKFGQAGFKFAKETFSWKRIVGELEQLYATAAA